jgi:hypothetical protein
MTSSRIASCRRGTAGRRGRLLTLGSGLLLGLVASLALTGCALVNEFASNQKEQVFATVADVQTHVDGEFVPPPFVPADATDLKMRMITDGPGEIMRFTSASTIAGEECAPGALAGSPLLESTWWPAEVPGEGIVCDSGWQVFQKDGNTYAWASV